MYLKSIAGAALPAALIFVALALPGVNCSPYIISDDRVRNLDVSPVLGRGYSIMTNSYQSTCLLVDETTVPSYNYDYSFYDFTQTTNMEVDLASKFSYSFGYWWLKGNVSADHTSETTVTTTTRYITASMRIERYYASLKEEASPLSTDAQSLLNNEDYIGFFKACGPNYIRGIRRAQEVVSFFIYTSTDDQRSSEYSQNVQVSSWWWNQRYKGSRNRNTKFNSESQSMRIVIQGYGLGLSQEGSETLLAESLEDFNRVMKFAFNTMTRIPDSLHIGMVYGMEIVPWVENVSFQVQANLLDDAIEIPMARSLIPRSYLISDPTDLTFDNSSPETRALSTCKEPSFEKDKYGYCCEIGALYDTTTREYSVVNPEARVCRPIRILDPALVKDNLLSNGEYVARMDRSVRYKLNQLSTLERCISAARAIPDRYDYHILKSMDTVKFDGSIDINFSVFELKMALDPFNDYGMLKQMAKELDEFLDMFVKPCYNALFGSNVGNSPETDPSYFMSYPWHAHDECTKLSCFGNSMRWDRSVEGGGCTPSMISGSESKSYEGANCNKDNSSGEVKCKNDSTSLDTFHSKVVKAWKAVVPRGRVDYFMEHFCMPSITGEVLNAEAIDSLKEAHIKCCTDKKEQSVNVALNKLATSSTAYHSPYSGNKYLANWANDGNTSPYWWHRSMFISKYNSDQHWDVRLGRKYEIKRIVIHQRYESSIWNRLSGVRVELFSENTLVWTGTARDNVGQKIEFTLPPDKEGDKVKLNQKAGKRDYFNFSEVEVYNTFYA